MAASRATLGTCGQVARRNLQRVKVQRRKRRAIRSQMVASSRRGRATKTETRASRQFRAACQRMGTSRAEPLTAGRAELENLPWKKGQTQVTPKIRVRPRASLRRNQAKTTLLTPNH